MTASATEILKRTPLYELHLKLGARLVPFAGYEMPVQYPTGIVAEHNWTRANAGLFDVSHMGQATLIGTDHLRVATALEKLVPGDILGLDLGRIRYTQFTTPDGGIIDDLMVSRPLAGSDDGHLGIVVNASRKNIDYDWLRQHLPGDIILHRADERALLALQGPKAVEVLARHCAESSSLAFMSSTRAFFDGIDCHIARSGYTGEDGFEISVKAEDAMRLAETLLAEPEVKAIGLGARDSLRLEAGLCLYGHDIDEATSPVEAGLSWSIGKRRKREGGFFGAERILKELKDGPSRKRVGIKPDGRAPAREGAAIQTPDGARIGTVTSGGFGQTVNAPIAMGYVESRYAEMGTSLSLIVRDKPLLAAVAPLPFVPHTYKR
jgi:aminomethyltransferase